MARGQEAGHGELRPAAAAFAEFLARIDDGEDVDFTAFCAERPALAADLAVLHHRWQVLRGAFFADRDRDMAGAHAERGDEDDIRVEDDEEARARLLRDLVPDPARPRYAIAGEFARGGIAAILEARDRCLRRTLAMKVLLAERSGAGARADPRALARFLAEAQITSQLDHPGIPPVHELGIDPAGRVFFTMPLISGRNLSQVYALVREQREGWTLARAVSVLQRVCETVAYAHSRGVVHRDLKPANVMVGRFGETYVMDWGLARVRRRTNEVDAAAPDERLRVEPSSVRTSGSADAADSPLVTLAGHVIGTPAYMAPEQARGEVERVGPQADVYAIGAMLYELLAGHMPYVPRGARLSVRTVLARVVAGPPPPLRGPGRDVPEELAAICQRAMAREPAQRYPDVVALGEDLRAWIEGRVVRAHATGAWMELRKWIGRNRALAAASAALMLALAIGLLVTLELASAARRAARRLGDELRLNNLERGRLFAQAGNAEQAEKWLWPEHVRSPGSLETRWAMWDLYARYPCLASANGAGELRTAVLTANDRLLVVGDAAGRMQLLEPRTLRPLASLPPPGTPSAVTALAADATGTRLYGADHNGALHVFDLERRQLLRTLRAGSAPATVLALSSDGRQLLAGLRDGSVSIHDTASFAAVRRMLPGGGAVNAVAWSPDGRQYAVASSDWWVRVFATHSGECLVSYRARDKIRALLFTPQGMALFGGDERMLCALDPATNEIAWTISSPDAFCAAVFTDGAARLVTYGFQRIDLWSVAERARQRSIPLPGQVRTMLVDRDGDFAVTVHAGEVRAWDLADLGRWTMPGHEGRVASAASRDGRWVATGDTHGVVRLFDTMAGSEPLVLGQHEGRVRCVVFDPDGERLLSGAMDGTLRLWDVGTRRLSRTFADHDDSSTQSACFSPDGRSIASAVHRAGQDAILVCRVADGSELLTIASGSGQILGLCYSPDGTRLACTSRGHGVRLFDLTGRLLGEWATLDQAWTPAFRADGRKLATGTWGRAIELFDVATGRREGVLEGHAGTVWDIDWARDDPRLLWSASADGTVRLWDVERRALLLVLQPFGGDDVLAVDIADRGRLLVASGAGPAACGWDLAYYERHVAGNVRAQLERLGAETPGAEAVRAWSSEVLARPWPRWQRRRRSPALPAAAWRAAAVQRKTGIGGGRRGARVPRGSRLPL